MRRDIALAGFVLTSDEWDAMDELVRRQLLSIAAEPDDYESYQLFYASSYD
jgi:hypothetical protein